ncbi:MAG: hypothetical protein AB8H86_13560 [Polyangiales bacterium]
MSAPKVLAAGFSPRVSVIGALGTTAAATAMGSALGAAIGAGFTEAGFSAEKDGFFGAGVMDFGFGAGATDLALAFCRAYCAAGESNDGSDFFRGSVGLVAVGAKPEARLTACSSGVADRCRDARWGGAGAGAAAAAAAGAWAAGALRTRGSSRRS